MNKVILTIIILFISLQDISYSQVITWQRTYGDENIDYGYAIEQTPDEGYLAGGRKRIGATSYMYLMRLDKFGNKIWDKTYPGSLVNNIKKVGENYLVLGSYIMLVDINGDTIWTNQNVSGRNVEILNDGYIVCGGEIYTGSLFRPRIQKIDLKGSLIWSKVYSNNIYDGLFRDLKSDSLGNLYLVGNMSDSAYIWDKLFIMKTDSDGNELNRKVYEELNYYYCNKIFINDNNFIVGGSFFLLRLFANLEIDTLLEYDFEDSNYQFYDWNKNYDGTFVATGSWDVKNNFDYFVLLMKTDRNGNYTWKKTFGFNDNDVGINVKQTQDSGFVTIGIRDNYNLGDIYIIKTDSMGFAAPHTGISNITTIIPETFKLYDPYPNPFNSSFKIKFDINRKGNYRMDIFNIEGKLIKNIFVRDFISGSYEASINNLNDVSSSIYIIRVSSDLEFQSRKILLIK